MLVYDIGYTGIYETLTIKSKKNSIKTVSIYGCKKEIRCDITPTFNFHLKDI